MRITPLDVRKQEFRKAVRGFDCDEVRAFLTTLADEYETVLVDNKQIRERVMEQDEKITEYRTMERTLRDTLMTAERLMQETRENANREGKLIIQEAQLKAREVLQECRLRTEELRREIVGLRKEKETYLARFKGLAEAQIQFVDSHKNDFIDLDKRLVDMVDSVVAGVDEKITANSTKINTPVSVEMPPAAETTFAAERPVDAAVYNVVPDRVDVWRDYKPETTQESEKSQESQKTAETLISAVNSVSSVEAEKPSEEASSVNAATVDFAAMGIPVPAIPAAVKSEEDNDTGFMENLSNLAESSEPVAK